MFPPKFSKYKINTDFLYFDYIINYCLCFYVCEYINDNVFINIYEAIFVLSHLCYIFCFAFFISRNEKHLYWFDIEIIDVCLCYMFLM